MTTVLVIEDDDSTRDIIETYLHQHGFEAVLADDGTGGIQQAQALLPNLVLCDLLLPDVSGYEVLQVLRDTPATAHVPFIFLTARTDRANQRTGMALGADDYLMKPFTNDELIGAIEARLRKHNQFTDSYEQKLHTLRQNIILAVPHEMRSPLMGIIGYAEMMTMDADQLTPQQVSEMAGEIVRAGWRLHRVVENTLLMAQVELTLSEPARAAAVARELEPQPQRVIKMVVSEVSNAHHRPAALHVEVKQPVYANSENMTRILWEIIDNAFKFSADDTQVRVWTTFADGYLVVAVENEGRGMSHEQVSSIGAYMQFERTLHEQQGLGLGLIIARRLLEMHHGKLVIESIPNGITTVYAYFRLA